MHAADPVSYHSVRVNAQDISYREAGRKNAPLVLLLHGFPSSSRMYRPLLASALNTRYRLIVPDYPGFGHSSWPAPKSYPYPFDHLARTMQAFADELHLDQYTLFLQDDGGPVGPAHGDGTPGGRFGPHHPERYGERGSPLGHFGRHGAPSGRIGRRTRRSRAPTSFPWRRRSSGT